MKPGDVIYMRSLSTGTAIEVRVIKLIPRAGDTEFKIAWTKDGGKEWIYPAGVRYSIDELLSVYGCREVSSIDWEWELIK